jgi:hypothetical protein
MKKTPDNVSKERQKIGQEMAVWKARIWDSHLGEPSEVAQKIAFCEEQLKECRKRLRALSRKSKKTFWVFSS